MMDLKSNNLTLILTITDNHVNSASGLVFYNQT